MHPYTLPLAAPQADLETVGGKGMSLAKLANAGLPVPGGFHLTTEAYRQFVSANNLQDGINDALKSVDTAQPSTLEVASKTIGSLFAQAAIPPKIAEAITGAYEELSAAPVSVAVRSSATAEDLPDASFAGQQDTYLNMIGTEAVLAATKKCWASLWTARAIGYRARQGIGAEGVALAVVVQEMVFADAAGIMFTANPINGKRDEAVINAAWGLGEAVVGGVVTPDTLTVNKPKGSVVSHEIAEKLVMTIRTESGTDEQPVPDHLQNKPVLSDEQAIELARLGTEIETLYEMPMDIEWTLADGKFAIVQARPITALPPVSEAGIEPPSEWVMPKPKGQYVRASISELMPEPLTPLFGTLGRAAINTGTQQLMAKLGRMKAVGMEEMVVTINDYAYYTTSFTAKQLFMLLMNMPFTMPRMIRDAERYWREEVHVRYVETIERWQANPLDELSAADILVGVRQLAAASFDVYATYQSALFARANMSEMLFTRVYEKMIKRDGDPDVLTYILGFDSTPILAEESVYDIAERCRTRPALVAYVRETPATELSAQLENAAPSGVEAEDWLEWQTRWQTHIEQFGHLIYDLDFAKPLPADNPAPLLDTCKMFLSDQCPNPYERQRAAAERREQATQAMLGKLKGLRRKLFEKLVGWAQDSVPLREEGLADLGLGYPQLRRMLRELGGRLVEANAIEQVDDVFWLHEDEADQAAEALDKSETVTSFVEQVEQRKATWRAEMRATPPPVLPPKSKWMGLKLDKFIAAEDAEQVGNIIQGAGTSPGRVTGTARVLHGQEDFAQLQPGDILVAQITTPAWTPLFSRAAAIVTDIGGQLSHGSIVAREYGIPAVMGTGVATKSIQSGQTITVDGSTGEVVLHRSEDTPAPPEPIEWPQLEKGATLARGSLAEHTPSPVSPLFATLGLRIANEETERLWTNYIDVDSTGLFLSDGFYMAINNYVYGGFVLNRKNWWVIIKMSLTQLGPILRGAPERWRAAHDTFVAVVDEWEAKEIAAFTPSELMKGASTVFHAAVKYYTVIQTTLPAASMGEIFFQRFYNALIKRKTDPEFTTFLFGFETLPVRAEKSLYDVAMWIKENPALADYTLRTPTSGLVTALEAESTPDGIPANLWLELRTRLDAHFAKFGRTAYEFDFMNPTPAEAPSPQLEAIKLFVEGKGVSPYARHKEAADKRKQATESVLTRVGPLRRHWFKKLLQRAQETGEIREDSIAVMGLGHPLIRKILGILGERFAAGNAIATADDIYWLEETEVEELIAALENDEALPDMKERIPARKEEWQAALHIVAPAMLPEKSGWQRFIGGGAPEEKDGKTVLKGLGTSTGKVTAPACILFSPEDFPKMKQGDVLVATTTTPAWTPLFALASAIVTDIGGPLSHSSIVAREYGIPAVMAARNATRHIKNGQMVTVDGKEGTVILE